MNTICRSLIGLFQSLQEWVPLSQIIKLLNIQREKVHYRRNQFDLQCESDNVVVKVKLIAFRLLAPRKQSRFFYFCLLKWFIAVFGLIIIVVQLGNCCTFSDLMEDGIRSVWLL